MNPSYRLGLRVVAAAIAVAACLAPFVPRRPARPAAEDLSARPFPLGDFRLVERSGRAVEAGDLADRVWIASFLFTRCPSSCPRIAAVMRRLQDDLAGTGIQLVSLTVDPEHDTPEVLDAYARRLGADADRWWFLSGPKSEIDRLVVERFKLPLQAATGVERAAGAEAVMHTTRVALVDRGNRVVGLFDADDPAAVAALKARARPLDSSWVLRLPAINAGLNGLCGVLLLAGWALIRAGRVKAHIACMAAGVAASALFLAGYLVYHHHVGSVPFRGVGAVRAVYFTVLLSHTTLAMVNLPMVVLTLARALRGRYARHAAIARVTLPIWLYVSITGVVVYAMLYHLDAPASLS